MTQEKQRIAIAEACGFRPKTDRHKPMWVTPDSRTLVTMPDHLPNYLNDLNAMHEAEKGLDATRQNEYSYQLEAACCPREYGWHATAAQRAEAFLRTIDKWEETE
jgi:uncharacterized protein YdeI (YjbR/CyaY-like superfamily)